MTSSSTTLSAHTAAAWSISYWLHVIAPCLQVRYTRCNNNPSQVVLGRKLAELEGAALGGGAVPRGGVPMRLVTALASV
jgi:hypothetical protein